MADERRQGRGRVWGIAGKVVVGAAAAGATLAVTACGEATCGELRACPPAASGVAASAGAGGAGGSGGVGGGSGGVGAAGAAGNAGARGDLGERCTGDADCRSGHCVDGVCCVDACTGPCLRCDGASPGACAPVAEGLDPDQECTGAGSAAADLACAGSCDGVGGCRFPGASTACGTASCTGTALIGMLCDGQGVCAQGSVDCDDGLHCNGVEECRPAGCVAGVPPTCTVTDSARCTPTCREGTTAHECAAAARDTDGDGHGTALCAEAPGDDCDDGVGDVHPGAPERCNGLDDDCDGAVDLDDGLALGGRLHTVAEPGVTPALPSVAWDAVGGAFGVVWTDGSAGNEEVYFARVDPAGTVLGGTLRVTDTPDDEAFPTVTADAGVFVVTWTLAGGGGPRLRRVSGAGALVGSAVELDPSAPVGFGALGVQVAHVAGGPWLVAWTHTDFAGADSLRGAAVADDGTVVVPARTLLGGAGEPVMGGMAMLGGAPWASYVDVAGQVRVAPLTVALDPLGLGVAITSGGGVLLAPALLARADDLWVGYSQPALPDDEEIRVARVGTASGGTLECQPVVLGSGPRSLASAPALAATRAGILGVYVAGPGDGTSAVLAQRYDAACAVRGAPLNLSGGNPWRAQGAALPRVASGPDTVGVAWADGVAGRVLLYSVGALLCE